MIKYYWEKPARLKAWLLNHNARGLCTWVVEETTDGHYCIAQWARNEKIGYYLGA